MFFTKNNLKEIKLFINNLQQNFFIFNKNKKLIYINKEANNNFNYELKDKIDNSILEILINNSNYKGNLKQFINESLNNKIDELILTNNFHLFEFPSLKLNSFKFKNYYILQIQFCKDKKIKFYEDMNINLLLDTFPLPIFIKNKEGFIINCNKKFLSFLQLKDKKQIINKTLSSIDINKDIIGFHEQEDYEFIIEAEKKYKEQKDISNFKKIYDYEFNFNNKTGIARVYKNIFIENNKVQGLIGVIINKTEEKRIEKELKNKNYNLLYKLQIDHLTGIKNRLAFDIIFKEKIDNYKRYNKNRTIILYIIDIDHFKVINDTYGHDVGDIVLRKLTKIISNSIRNSDSFFRIGGEEFAIITDGIEIEDAKIFVNKLLTQIRKYKIKQINNKNITISIGITQLKELNEKTEIIMKKLYKQADIALYKAKTTGRDKFIIYRGDEE